MPDHIVISRNVQVGRRPPDGSELDALRKQGVRAVIDLRTETEPFGAAAAPSAEAAQVRARGMAYLHVPVSAQGVDQHDLDRVGQALAEAPKPVLIHCAVGRRAGMMAVVHAAIEAGVPGHEMLEMARRLDVAFGDPGQQQVFARYVDQHESRADPLKRRHEALRADGGAIPLLPEGTRTLAADMREDHHREFVQDDGRPAPQVSPAPDPLVPMRTATVAHPSAPARSLPASPAAIGAGVLGGAVFLALGRRLRLVVLTAAVMAGCVAVLRSSVPGEPLPADESRRLDRDLADLERQLRRLGKSA